MEEDVPPPPFSIRKGRDPRKVVICRGAEGRRDNNIAKNRTEEAEDDTKVAGTLAYNYTRAFRGQKYGEAHREGAVGLLAVC